MVFSSDNCTDEIGVISETCFYIFNDSSVEYNALKRHAEIQTIGGVIAMNTGPVLSGRKASEFRSEREGFFQVSSFVIHEKR